jgi:hypothetical protein
MTWRLIEKFRKVSYLTDYIYSIRRLAAMAEQAGGFLASEGGLFVNDTVVN